MYLQKKLEDIKRRISQYNNEGEAKSTPPEPRPNQSRSIYQQEIEKYRHKKEEEVDPFWE